MSSPFLKTQQTTKVMRKTHPTVPKMPESFMNCTNSNADRSQFYHTPHKRIPTNDIKHKRKQTKRKAPENTSSSFLNITNASNSKELRIPIEEQSNNKVTTLCNPSPITKHVKHFTKQKMRPPAFVNTEVWKRNHFDVVEQPSEITDDSHLHNKLKYLEKQMMQMKQENELLKMKIGMSVKREKTNKKKNAINPLEWQFRLVAKQMIYPKVKFITNKSELQSFSKPGSIGYSFITSFEEMYDTTVGDKEMFWSQAQDHVYSAILQKRNAVQTAVKRKWFGKFT